MHVVCSTAEINWLSLPWFRTSGPLYWRCSFPWFSFSTPKYYVTLAYYILSFIHRVIFLTEYCYCVFEEVARRFSSWSRARLCYPILSTQCFEPSDKCVKARSWGLWTARTIQRSKRPTILGSSIGDYNKTSDTLSRTDDHISNHKKTSFTLNRTDGRTLRNTLMAHRFAFGGGDHNISARKEREVIGVFINLCTNGQTVTSIKYPGLNRWLIHR